MNSILAKLSLVNQYLQPVELSLATSTNTLSICILCSRALRSSPCAYYFLAFTIFSTIYILLTCAAQIFHTFSLDWTSSDVGCKTNSYLLYLTPTLARAMIVLASFDRYCSSSDIVRLRSKSTVPKAKLTILITSILLAFDMLPALALYHWDESINLCTVHTDLISDVYLSIQLLLVYILAPILMIIFGVMTIYNIHKQVNQAGTQIVLARGNRRTEGQLARMLLLQICVDLIITIPYGVVTL